MLRVNLCVCVCVAPVRESSCVSGSLSLKRCVCVGMTSGNRKSSSKLCWVRYVHVWFLLVNTRNIFAPSP